MIQPQQPASPTPSGSRRLAVLIDGDNAQPSLVEPMFAALAAYGQPIVRRIYGDWSRVQMRGWLDAMAQFAFQPRQHFPAASGKNSTDIALIIDTMDLLYANEVDGFCIVSSDSDYTPLASRIREGGGFVIGIGKRMTPDALVRVCDVFLFSEDLLPPSAQDEPSLGPPPRFRKRSATTVKTRIKGGVQKEAPLPAAPPKISSESSLFDVLQRNNASLAEALRSTLVEDEEAQSVALGKSRGVTPVPLDSAPKKAARPRSRRTKQAPVEASAPEVQAASEMRDADAVPASPVMPAPTPPAEAAPKRKRAAKAALPAEPPAPEPDEPAIAVSKSIGRKRGVSAAPSKAKLKPAAEEAADTPLAQGGGAVDGAALGDNQESPWRMLGDAEAVARAPRVKAAPGSKPDPKQIKRVQPVPSAFFELFQRAFELAVRPDGWAQLSALSNRLHQIDPEFKPRTYGYSRLSQLVEAYPEHFELKQMAGETNQVYVRPRKTGHWRALK